MKKVVSVFLAAVLLTSVCAAFAIEKGESRAVIGADISAEQKAAVYSSFGVEQGAVSELIVTNAEERSYLDGLVDPSIIGTRSISCVYIEILGEGDGLEVSTSNI